MYEIGVLDLCHIHAGEKASDVLWNTIELAPKGEMLGYSRYWLGEHHSVDVAHSCPELLAGVLAGLTTNIRIGTAGILLQYYSPLKVAKSMRLLHALYPNRIDLGIARGRVPEITGKLLTGSSVEQTSFEAKFSELLAFLRGKGEITPNPTGVAPPEIWLLGSGTTAMQMAAHYGTAFCLALFLNDKPPHELANIIAEYEQTFKPSSELKTPQWSIAFAGSLIDPNAQIQKVELGRLQVFPSIIDGPDRCIEFMGQLEQIFKTDKFIFLDVSSTFEEKLISYERLSAALGLAVMPVQAGP
jgi:luciferase family oxidoreductase group 1